MAGSSKKAIYAAMFGNGAIAITKFVAATMTGSSAMFSEGVHSLVDTGNQVLLLYGLKRAQLPASPEFPFGHGKEVYFWSFVVAILIFGLGAGISLYQGWQHFQHPQPIDNVMINYVVLGLAIVFEGGALFVAMREFNAHRGDMSFLQAVKRGKDPSLFVVVFEDSAAMLGLLVALGGIAIADATGNYQFDGLASMTIGVILAVTAAWLAYESKGLLIGESADVELVAQIEALLAADGRLHNVNEVATLQMGPNTIIATLSVDFKPGMNSDEVQATVTEINRAVKAIDSNIKRVFVEPESSQDHFGGGSPSA